ncbi:adhesion G-protein coupled receptor G4-like [Acanthaster planci]|uniref:Adhesion G-protein coupled receptor G4-like n=1 Tax=Acanthaster planci TaxID=133434 RepID=A0A8B7XJN7_ACAPL|nr:adhesion G-protein coupled receptor G4-like [Acanthaster planci]
MCSDGVNNYTCECAPGYTDTNCSTDIDDCDPNPCMNRGMCSDGVNNYTCTCAPGYTDTNCTTDIDDCNPNRCANGGTCTDDVNDYICTCASGYTDKSCTTDIDECLDSPCPSGADCMNQPGSFICVCPDGYTWNTTHCIDIDECSTQESVCPSSLPCQNLKGSFTCVCQSGFVFDGSQCNDVNECEEISSCPPTNRPCINSIGGFACTCPSGYEWNSSQCIDMDECLADKPPCPELVPCRNTVGSFTCLCNQGYAWDGRNCSDVDECLDMPCSDEATCVNQPGGFTCLCPSGYFWNGTSCDDVDECAQGTPICPSMLPCQNTIGSFTCICPEGFAWNGTQCADVDECQTSDPACPALAACNNTYGSFQCHCQDGYTLTSQSQSSFKFCMDIDECQDEALYDCHGNATCINVAGSYRCMCLEAQGYRGDGKVCTPFDLCESGPCLNQGRCTSSLGSGSYECECTQDFTGVSCGISAVPQGPAAVLKHPEPSRILVSQYDTVSLECQFENVASFAWYRNGQRLAGSTGLSFLMITGVTSDRGYYWCEGFGLGGVTVRTNSSLILIEGVFAFTAKTRFPTLTFVEELRNKSSQRFQNVAGEIATFQAEGLQSRGVPSNVVVQELASGSILATSEILTQDETMPSDNEVLGVVKEALVAIATASGGFMDPSSITMESSGSCVESSLSSIYGIITFPAGALGSTTQSNPDRLCPDYTINSGQRIAFAVCVGDGFSLAQWVFEVQCGRNLTVDERLALLNQVTVTMENVMEVASQVVTLTEEAAMLTDEGVASTADIMEKVADVNSDNVEVTVTVVDTVGNLMDTSEDSLMEAQMRTQAPRRIVEILERQLIAVPVASNMSFREIHPNIAVEVRSVSESTLLSGLGFTSVNASSMEALGESSLMVMEGDEMFEGNQDSEMPSAVLILPPEVNILARRDGNDGGIRVSFSVFRRGNLFLSLSLADFNDREDRFNRTINTRIMSATVGSQPITNLNEPVTILLTRIDNDSYVTNTSCVFWDTVEGDWSTEGCRIREHYPTDQHIACQCDHLTNFAALMDIYPESPLTETQEFILKLLSLVGCGMSILGLAVTMVTYLSHMKLREKRPNRILLSLCFSLLCLYITFVVATALDSERGVAELDVLPCCILAAFLHYFTLTSLCWMGVEGCNLYLLFVKVVNVYVPKFMLKASLAAWGLPVLVVAITAGVTREDYVATDFCFLKQTPLIASLLAPIGLILLFNIVIFSLVIRQFVKTSNDNIRRNTKDLSRRKVHKQRLQNALTVMTLMGLTWSIGYLNLVQAVSFPVQLVFCLLNTLQGYFIFMLYGVRQPEVRKHWKRCCFFQRGTFSSVRTSSYENSSSARPQLRAPFDPKTVPRPKSQIYRQRPGSSMPPM